MHSALDSKINMSGLLIQKAKQALAEIEPMEAKNFPPAESIARQLRWCIALFENKPEEEMLGLLTMGLIASREFDMYGDNPQLAQLINEIQHDAQDLLSNPAFKRDTLKRVP